MPLNASFRSYSIRKWYLIKYLALPQLSLYLSNQTIRYDCIVTYELVWIKIVTNLPVKGTWRDVFISQNALPFSLDDTRFISLGGITLSLSSDGSRVAFYGLWRLADVWLKKEKETKRESVGSITTAREGVQMLPQLKIITRVHCVGDSVYYYRCKTAVTSPQQTSSSGTLHLTGPNS